MLWRQSLTWSSQPQRCRSACQTSAAQTARSPAQPAALQQVKHTLSASTCQAAASGQELAPSRLHLWPSEKLFQTAAQLQTAQGSLNKAAPAGRCWSRCPLSVRWCPATPGLAGSRWPLRPTCSHAFSGAHLQSAGLLVHVCSTSTLSCCSSMQLSGRQQLL